MYKIKRFSVFNNTVEGTRTFSRMKRVHKEATALFNQGKHGEALRTLERYADMARKGSTDALKSVSSSENPVKIWEVTKGTDKSSKRIKNMMESIKIPGKVGKNKPFKIKDGGKYDPKPLIQVTDYGKINKVAGNKNPYLGSKIHINNY